MCVINDFIQDIVEYEAKKLVRTNKNISYGDLVQEGLLPMIADKVKAGQVRAYYKRIAFNAMIKWINKQHKGGIVTHHHGGDRKSKDFKCQQDLMRSVHTVSLDSIPCELSDTPIRFGKKGSPPEYDTYNYPESKNDHMTENFLRGRIG